MGIWMVEILRLLVGTVGSEKGTAYLLGVGVAVCQHCNVANGKDSGIEVLGK